MHLCEQCLHSRRSTCSDLPSPVGVCSVEGQAQALALPEDELGRSSSLHSEDCLEWQPLPFGRCPLDSELAIFWLRRPLLLRELLIPRPFVGLPSGKGAAGRAAERSIPARAQELRYVKPSSAPKHSQSSEASPLLPALLFCQRV